MSITTLEYVEAPPVTPLPYGLLSVAQVVDHGPDDTHWQLGGVQWEPSACSTVGTGEGICTSPVLFAIGADFTDSNTLSIYPDNSYLPAGDYTVDWGDASSSDVTGDELNGGDFHHDYAGGGPYTVTITGPTGVASGTVAAADAYKVLPFSTSVDQDGVGTVTAHPFLVFTELTCRLRDDLEARAREAMRLRAPFGVERQMAALLRYDYAADTVVENAHPVDAIAQLELYAGARYGGLPVIHVSRALATVLVSLGAVKAVNGHLETPLGSLVAAGAGYDQLRWGVAAPTAGTEVVHVTGAVRVDRPIQPDVFGPYFGRDDATGNRTNDQYVRAQAEHTIGWECLHAAATVRSAYTVPVPA